MVQPRKGLNLEFELVDVDDAEELVQGQVLDPDDLDPSFATQLWTTNTP